MMKKKPGTWTVRLLFLGIFITSLMIPHRAWPSNRALDMKVSVIKSHIRLLLLLEESPEYHVQSKGKDLVLLTLQDTKLGPRLVQRVKEEETPVKIDQKDPSGNLQMNSVRGSILRK